LILINAVARQPRSLDVAEAIRTGNLRRDSFRYAAAATTGRSPYFLSPVSTANPAWDRIRTPPGKPGRLVRWRCWGPRSSSQAQGVFEPGTITERIRRALRRP